jgi:hypothetical protein
MARLAAIAVVLGLTSASGVARAAPTCLDAHAGPIRCGVEGAMPVGWRPTAEQQADRESGLAEAPTIEELVAMLYVVGAIFALIALMPPFDGRDGADWDEQEGDREGRR